MRFAYSSGQRPLAGYTIKRGIARGGFGEVYFGLSDGGKEVALKCLFEQPEIELRGVRHCLNLKHPHLVHLYDLKKDERDRDWLVMEYVRGETLHAVLQRHPRGLERDLACQWFAQIAAAVHGLHEQGIVHRDLKPANIFLENGKALSGSQRTAQTQSVGTVHYMAPEVGRGNYTRSVDVYAAGIVLYEMLTGKVPFEGETTAEILLKHLSQTPNVDDAGPFAGVIRKALEKDPEARYPTLAEMARRAAEIGPARSETSVAPPARVTARRETAALSTVVMPPTSHAPETIRTLFIAGILALTLTLVWAALPSGGDWRRMTPALLITILTSWSLLLAARVWPKATEDSLPRRLGLGVLGVGIGLFAVWLEGYSLFGGDALRPVSGEIARHPFYDALSPTPGGLSPLVGYASFFGLLFMILRWWRLAELERPGRFTLPSLLATSFWAFVLLFLLPTGEQREIGFASALLTSVVVQLAAPRREPRPEPSKRLRWQYA